MTHLGAFPVSFQRSSFFVCVCGGIQFFPKKQNKTKYRCPSYLCSSSISAPLLRGGHFQRNSPEPLLPLRTGLGPTETLCFSRTGEQSYLGPACLINNAGPELHFWCGPCFIRFWAYRPAKFPAPLQETSLCNRLAMMGILCLPLTCRLSRSTRWAQARPEAFQLVQAHLSWPIPGGAPLFFLELILWMPLKFIVNSLNVTEWQ